MEAEKEHSVQSYIERYSSIELLGLLRTCMWRNEWYQHRHTIPLIFNTLQVRNVPIPEQIQTAWENFLTIAETSAE